MDPSIIYPSLMTSQSLNLGQLHLLGCIDTSHSFFPSFFFFFSSIAASKLITHRHSSHHTVNLPPSVFDLTHDLTSFTASLTSRSGSPGSPSVGSRTLSWLTTCETCGFC